MTLPDRPYWLVREEIGGSLPGSYLSEYTCDYSLTIAGSVDEVPDYLYIDDSANPAVLKFKAGPANAANWPVEPCHDHIVLNCEIEDYFSISRTIEVMFYSFDYDADDGLPNDDRCIHTANQMFDEDDMPPRPERSDLVKSFRHGGNDAWIECCFNANDSDAVMSLTLHKQAEMPTVAADCLLTSLDLDFYKRYDMLTDSEGRLVEFAVLG